MFGVHAEVHHGIGLPGLLQGTHPKIDSLLLGGPNAPSTTDESFSYRETTEAFPTTSEVQVYVLAAPLVHSMPPLSHLSSSFLK